MNAIPDPPASARPPRARGVSPLRIATGAARLLDKYRGLDVVVYDLGPGRGAARYFVIATGDHPRHLSTMADCLTEYFQLLSERPQGIHAREGWTLIDYGDCVILLFEDTLRRYYGLEEAWKDKPQVDWTSS